MGAYADALLSLFSRGPRGVAFEATFVAQSELANHMTELCIEILVRMSKLYLSIT
jgi:hypothetical protein